MSAVEKLVTEVKEMPYEVLHEIAMEWQKRAERAEAALATARRDAERGRYMIAHGCWHRGEEQTHLAVLVKQGSDLSCYAMREAAIDRALAGKE